MINYALLHDYVVLHVLLCSCSGTRSSRRRNVGRAGLGPCLNECQGTDRAGNQARPQMQVGM